MLKEILKTNKNEINVKNVSNLNNDKIEKEELILDPTYTKVSGNLNTKKQGSNQD